jgi:hypothetical protein
MSAPPSPPIVDELGGRHFALFPPIHNIEFNEWICQRGNWSELLLHNIRLGMDIWIPRSYLGEISWTEDPIVIVGLKRELEYKGGSVVPHARRVVSMPGSPRPMLVPDTGTSKPQGNFSAAMSEVRAAQGTESWVSKAILTTIFGGLVLVAGVVWLMKMRSDGGDLEFKTVMQTDLGFSYASDYHDVVRKLGTPEKDVWKNGTTERQFRALSYPKNDLIIILMGDERNDSAKYIGAKDASWRTVSAVSLPGGQNTEAMLRALQRF